MSEEKIRHIIEVFENDYCEKCSEFNCLEGSMEEIITAMKQLQQENKALKEDISFCLHSIKQEMEMSTDSRTRNEMTSCYEILKRWSK